MEEGRSYSPWVDLGTRGHVELRWAWLPDVVGHGTIRRQPEGRTVVTICCSADRPHRRAALTHELVHDDRGIYGPDVPDLVMVKEEAYVRRLTATRLVPPTELAEWAAARAEVGPVTAYDVAEEFDVPVAVALESMRLGPPPD